MKPLIFITLLICFISLSALENPQYSLFGGVTQSWGNDHFKDNEAGNGFNIGLSTYIDGLLPTFVIEPGFRYITKNSIGTYTIATYSTEAFYKTSSFDIFCRLKKEIEDSPLTPFTGFSINYLHNAYIRTVGTDFISSINANEYFATLDLTFLFGAELPIQDKYTFGVEYNVGLTNILDSKKFSKKEANHRTLLFNFGILY